MTAKGAMMTIMKRSSVRDELMSGDGDGDNTSDDDGSGWGGSDDEDYDKGGDLEPHVRAARTAAGERKSIQVRIVHRAPAILSGDTLAHTGSCVLPYPPTTHPQSHPHNSWRACRPPSTTRPQVLHR
jgi:hypothetical protein